MASEIGLNLSQRYDTNDPDIDKVEKLRWNDLRTKAFMIINEYRWAKHNG
jgi:hypothetical protein